MASSQITSYHLPQKQVSEVPSAGKRSRRGEEAQGQDTAYMEVDISSPARILHVGTMENKCIHAYNMQIFIAHFSRERCIPLDMISMCQDSPFDGPATRQVKKAYTEIDKLSIRIGIALRWVWATWRGMVLPDLTRCFLGDIQLLGYLCFATW